MDTLHKNLKALLIRQLAFFGDLSDTDHQLIELAIPEAINATNFCIRKYTSIPTEFSILQTHHSIVFLYYLAKYINATELISNLPEKVYLLNRMLNGVDLYYKINMPRFFLVGHGLGTVFSKAKFGEYLVVFQNVTIGTQDGCYPQIGNKVVIYPNSLIVGDSVIGNNCVISAGTKLINKNIPDNSIVFSIGRRAVIKPNSRDEIKKYFDV